MADVQETKQKQDALKPTTAFRDLLIIFTSCVVVFILSYFFNVFIFLVRVFQKHPSSITWIDEIISLFVTLSIGLAIFAWRRLLELRKETKERMRLQEELLDACKTQMEIEKIISKQLHVEIGLRKEEERKNPRKENNHEQIK